MGAVVLGLVSACHQSLTEALVLNGVGLMSLAIWCLGRVTWWAGGSVGKQGESPGACCILNWGRTFLITRQGITVSWVG